MNNNVIGDHDSLELKILFFAKLKEIVGEAKLTISLKAGSRVSDLKNEIIKKYPLIADYQSIMVVSINQNFAFDDDELKDQDEVAFFPPVSGGTMNENDILEITYDELEFDSLISKSIQSSTGAVVMFTGVIRGETKDIEHPLTKGLEYESYIPMAKTKLQQVADEIRSKWPTIQKIFIIQRIGYMDAETPTIVVLCSAAHRNTGVFDAAKYGIDRVKEIVPIWKKEISPDGETWIEGNYIPGKDD